MAAVRLAPLLEESVKSSFPLSSKPRPSCYEPFLLQDGLVTLIKAAVKRLSVSGALIKQQKSATSHPLVQVSRGPFAWTETFC